VALSGGFTAVRLTVPLRRVRGFPALGLLRGLCPSLETSLGLAACRLRDVGARVEVLMFREGDPWCGRWTALPLAARTARRIGTRRWRTHIGRTQSAVVTNRALAACSPFRASLRSIQRFQSPSSAARALARAWFHHGTCGNPPQGQRAPLRAFKAARLLQAAVPTSATFAAPFCARPDSGEDDIVRSSVTSAAS